jgi:hypothetical protein
MRVIEEAAKAARAKYVLRLGAEGTGFVWEELDQFVRDTWIAAVEAAMGEIRETARDWSPKQIIDFLFGSPDKCIRCGKQGAYQHGDFFFCEVHKPFHVLEFPLTLGVEADPQPVIVEPTHCFLDEFAKIENADGLMEPPHVG